MKRCFLMGHSDAPNDLLPSLSAEIERHITELGVTEFLVGSHDRFDTLAAKALTDTKKRHPQVTLTLLLAYHPGERPVKLPDGFDGSFYPPDMEKVPRRLAIVRANRYAVDSSDCMIAYAWQPGSNTLKLMEYAQGRKRRGKIKVTLLPKCT